MYYLNDWRNMIQIVELNPCNSFVSTNTQAFSRRANKTESTGSKRTEIQTDEWIQNYLFVSTNLSQHSVSIQTVKEEREKENQNIHGNGSFISSLYTKAHRQKNH